MHGSDVENDTKGIESEYECLKCGNLIYNETNPGTCSKCGGGYQNRAKSLE